MKIGQYCQRQRCRHVELEQFWQAFASRGFVSDSWAFLLTLLAMLRRAVCPYVCPSFCVSVTLRYREHIGWNISKIISPLVRNVHSLQTQRHSWI